MRKVKKKKPWEDKVNDARVADRRIKYCKDCKRCWEISYYGNKESIYHYLDFPSYGKNKITCKICKRSKHNEQNVMDKLSV